MHGNSNIKKKGRSWVLWSSRVWKKIEKLWIHNGSERIHKTFYTFDFLLSFLCKLIKKTIASLNLRPSQRQFFSRNAVPATVHRRSRGLEFKNIAMMKLKLWGVTSWNLHNEEVQSRMQLGSRKPKEAERKWSQKEEGTHKRNIPNIFDWK